MKIELDIMPLLPPQDPDTDRLLRWLGSFKAVKCLIEQFKPGCMGDLYRTGDDLVLSFFWLEHRKDPNRPAPVFHAEQMAELVPVFLIVFTAEVHHPVPASDKQLFPSLMTGQTVFFQEVLSLEEFLCAKAKAYVPVFDILLPSLQFGFQPGDQLAQTPQNMLLSAVMREFVMPQSAGCGFSAFFLYCFLQLFQPFLFTEYGSTKVFVLHSGQFQSCLMSGFCVSGNGIGCPAFQAVFVLEVFGELVQVSLPVIDPGKGVPVCT